MIIGRIIGLLLVRFHKNSLSASFTTVLILPQSVILRFQTGIQCILYHFSCTIHQILRFPHIYEASGNNVRSCKNHIAVAFQRNHNDHNSIFCKMLTVTKNDISYISYTKSVYQDCSCVYSACYLCTLAVKLQNISGCKDKDILFGDSKFLNYIFCAVRCLYSP